VRLGFKHARDSEEDGLADAGSGGRRVTLKTDPSQPTKDRYGRLLANTYTTRGELEVAQLKRGRARVYVYRHKRFTQYKRYQTAARFAKKHDRRVWGACGGDFHTPTD
jgi:endonuclease YncB( thermonuclease family)